MKSFRRKIFTDLRLPDTLEVFLDAEVARDDLKLKII